jgi:hypothetical protein
MTEHLLIHCDYTEATWNIIAPVFQLPLYGQLPSDAKPNDRISFFMSFGSRKDKRKKLEILFTFWWMI